MIAAIVSLDQHTEGTTWAGISMIGPITFIDDNTPTQPTFPLEEAWMQIRRGSITGPLLNTFSTNVELEDILPINIVGDPALWILSIPPVHPESFLAFSGTYHWSLNVRDTSGTVWPIYQGILDVVGSPTKNLV